MQDLIDAVRASCVQGNWYAALYMALTLPDICGKLEDPNSKQSGGRYRKWFDKYLKPAYKSEFHGPDFHFLTAGDCWALRCSLLHEGTDEISAQQSREVLSQFKFTTQGFHRIMINDSLVLNVSTFCAEMVAGVEAWRGDIKGKKNIQERLDLMAKIETEGFNLGSIAQFGVTGTDSVEG